MSEPETELPKVFWRHYTPVARLGWTVASLPLMWALIAVCMVLVGLTLVFIVGAYPFMHFVWGLSAAPDRAPPPEEPK